MRYGFKNVKVIRLSRCFWNTQRKNKKMIYQFILPYKQQIQKMQHIYNSLLVVDSCLVCFAERASCLSLWLNHQIKLVACCPWTVDKTTSLHPPSKGHSSVRGWSCAVRDFIRCIRYALFVEKKREKCLLVVDSWQIPTNILNTLVTCRPGPGPALSRCNRCSCIGPRASEGPAPWCLVMLFIFARYFLLSRIVQTAY